MKQKILRNQQGKKPTGIIFKIFCTAKFLLIWLFFQTASAQNPCPGPGYQCSSGDITITRVTIVQGLAEGHASLPNSCNPLQDNLPVALQVDFNVTSQTRYGFIVVADVYINNIFSKKIAKCFPGTFAQGPKTEFVETYLDNTTILWPCGSVIQLRNVYTAWDNSPESNTNPSICTYLTATGSVSNCKKVAPKCRSYGPSESFTVISPLVANFTATEGTCTNLKRSWSFLSTSSGGQVPYTYTWDFGDGSPAVTTSANPITHEYETDGAKTVTLVVTDVSGNTQTDNETKIITVSTCCVGSTIGTAAKTLDNFCAGGSSDLSVTGTLGTGAAWKWYTGGCGTADNGTLVHTGPGFSVTPTVTTTYYVRAEGTCGTTNCSSVTVTVKPVPAAPTINVENNCGSSLLTISGEPGAIFTWNDGSLINPRTVTSNGTYTATQSVNGCSSTISETAAAVPKEVPGKPSVSVVNNCNGTSTLTVAGLIANATVNWLDDATNHDNPRTVTVATNYTATQTSVAGCTSTASDAVAAVPRTTPAKPTVSVVNNCDGTSTLTVTGLVANATVNWLDDASNHQNPRTVTLATTYSATQTSAAGCTSTASDAVTAAPRTTPAKPTIGVVNNCDGTSTLTVTGLVANATVNWLDDATNHDNPRIVNVATTYTATQTSAAGCTSTASDAVATAPRTTPAKPTIGVVNNCDGTSTLTVTGLVANATVNWLDDPTNHDNPRIVNVATSYTATQTSVAGCTSTASDAAAAAPRTTPGKPIVGVVNNCDGTSTLTVTGLESGATVNWADDATNHDNPRTVTVASSYTATQTALNGCTSISSDAKTAAPRTTPATPTFCAIQPSLCRAADGSIIVGSVTITPGTGLQYSIDNGQTWSNNNVFTPLLAGSVTGIKVKNADGCMASASCDASTCVIPEDLRSSALPTTGTTVAPQQINISDASSKESVEEVKGMEIITLKLEPKTNVLATPNPFTDKIRFSLQSGFSGRASLDLFNMMGQKVQTVFQGFIEAGKAKYIEYNVPATQRSTLMYVFSIGEQKVSGKLVGPR